MNASKSVPVWLVALLACTSCYSSRDDGGPHAGPLALPDAPAGNAAAAAAAGEPDKDDAATKAVKRARRLEVARLELEQTRLEAEQERVEAQHAVDKARRELAEAERDVKVRQEQRAPAELEDASIDLERAKNDVEHAQDEFDELTAMYEAEEFAAATKELVLKRGRHDLEMAQRRLELEAREFETLRAEDLPKKQRELEAALVDARNALASAEAKLRQVDLSNTIALKKAEHEILDIDEEAAEEAEEEEVATDAAASGSMDGQG